MASIVVAVAVLLGGPTLSRHRTPARGTGPRRVTAPPQFDELIHPSTRLSIVALLASADWIDFAFVRDRLGLSDSALSKQFATLEDAGYLAIDRPVTDRRRRVRVRLTDVGRGAFEGHVAALRAVVATADSATANL
jgi:DNA-binding transcriptional ArsR family regulator